MKTSRSFNEIKIYLEPREFLVSSPILPKSQLDRIVTILKKYEANITLFTWNCLGLTANETVEMLQALPKLETLSVSLGQIVGHVTIQAKKMPQLKTLKAMMVTGFYQIANLLPANSLTDCLLFTMDETAPLVRQFLSKQRNLKALKIWHPVDATLIKHLRLNELGLHRHRYNSNQLSKILHYQTNLKELSLESPISGNSFKWICENMPQLEDFDAQVIMTELDDLQHVSKLVKIKSFKTTLSDISDVYNVCSNTLTTLILEEDEGLSFSENITKANFRLIVKNFPAITDLRLMVNSAKQLCSVLYHFKSITKFSGWIEHPSGQRFTKNVYPNMKHLSLINEINHGEMNLIVDIVEAMPNLEYLSVNITMMFDATLMERFIDNSTNLKCFDMAILEFDDNFVCGDNFLKTLRRIDDHLTDYKIIFKTTRGESYLNILIGILSKEFNVKKTGCFTPFTFAVWRGSEKAIKRYSA